MLIMGHEVKDLDFLDADILEKLENASQRVFDACNEASKKNEKESEGVRIQCNAIAEFINELFGEGTAEVLIENGSNLFSCITVFSEVMRAIGECKAKQSKKIVSMIDKYSPARSKRK